MKKVIAFILTLILVGLFNGVIAQVKEDPNWMTKEKYYNTVIAPQRGLKPLSKELGPGDRKRSVLDVGNVWARISNAATLGYDRWGLCWEFPARSGITYRWTMAPLVGAKKKNPDGSYTKFFASGTRGAARFSEEEYQPLPGFDAGYVDEKNNIGIAFSDKPQSWPQRWPSLNDLPEHARKITYNQPRVGSTGFPGVLDGEVVAKREAYFVVTDNDPEAGNKPKPMDVRLDIWGLQWDDFLNQDFIIFRFILTNIGTDTLYDVYVGIHDDPDCPEQGSYEWTDDFAAFIPVGTDVEGYSPSEDSLLWNFTYLWDGDDKVEGLIASNVGWVGLKFLETPINPQTGEPMGITTFQVFPYSEAPQTETAEYDQLAGGIMAPHNVNPHPDDWTQTPNSFGPDITYVVGSGPFTLPPGGQLAFTFASIHARNKRDLFKKAMLCQLLYNNSYRAAEAPPEPSVRAVAGDRMVILYWDDRSERGIYYKPDGTIDHINDRLTGNNAFEGYKIYKSTDRGQTWGEAIIDAFGQFQGWIPIAIYDLKNGIQGESETRRHFNLGSDAGIRHYFIDRNVNNGYEYWYAVVAYDHDDGPIPPLENAIRSYPKEGTNTVAVIPGNPASGVTVGSADKEATHIRGNSDVKIPITVLDPRVTTGKKYSLTFKQGSTPFSLLMDLKDQDGNYVVTISRDTIKNYPYFYDPAIDNALIFDGLYIPVQDLPPDVNWDAVVDGDSVHIYDALTIDLTFEGFNADATIDSLSREALSSDYEIRIVNNPVTYPKVGSALNPLGTTMTAPFEIWNITTNTKVNAAIRDRGAPGFNWDDYDRIFIINKPYPESNPGEFNATSLADIPYRVRIYSEAASVPAGDKIRIVTNKILTKDDVYEFNTVKQTTTSMTASDLENIRVVPNPYVVSSPYEVGKYGVQKEVQFHHLPPKAIIRIYNVAGDLVRVINHEGGSIARWNLQSYNEQEVAFGVYIYHIEGFDETGRKIGEVIGKFALIK